ncbi:MAG: S-methyl-5-thioribose-1-phosphate isomerase [candidate division KSB1 bacterium]|nr:S-methyl-5-thioribose-1-phosphate isomerase [candidate division KSB1 bacterium]MDZ7334459.1 S-methyl-5-thioribose-1-phosphate isomerase [candidate division KSB1 bacterium]MDZ7355986.1 S-methyl-5-thioribose-1-phosphate isomerase [candidate division KSB1 bacterium]MDZ7375274.1 S-methyl-5-thioribose-1-phosphate isomerase [candidate division KSB1 bacterium]MDZ7400680.1 S-methyl-5-thioribose-1-phosphate isomerase [candidate division KSB1 bacterium]
MEIRTIEWKQNCVRIIDQTRLPLEEVYLDIYDYRELAQAIKQLRIRGAPAIGIAGAFGVCLGAIEYALLDRAAFDQQINRVIDDLAGTRPTAVNLFWALNRMRKAIESNRDDLPARLIERLIEEANRILEEDRETCRQIGLHGAALLADGDTVLTHCNAGALATGGIGTALGVIYTAVAQGKRIKVYADETRPLLQGARLTAWELSRSGINVTLICDNMAAWIMQQHMIQAILVGADRIAANGDVANKIGTYNLAVLAKHHGIPFYVVAPTSTFDLTLKSGAEIPIEQRDGAELSQPFGQRVTPEGVGIYNPAFDVTPGHLINAIICERGIIRPPYRL